MTKIYLGLGSNQGDRLENLKNALLKLQQTGQISACSSIYETAPKYETNQPEFLNLICCLETDLDLQALHTSTRDIEKSVGRTATYKNGPRVLDIDLLFSESAEYHSETLQIPHPRIAERAFVLVPFREIAAELKIDADKTTENLLSELQPEELREVRFYCSAEALLQNSIIKCRQLDLNFKNKILVMGIMNITPDSFSGDGLLHNQEKLVRQAEVMLADGADILDIGGESTRPGHTQISVQQEIDRIVPAINKILNSCDAVISIDTYKSKVAEAALQAGAKIVNDVWGLQYDQQMAATVKNYEAAVIVMHNSSDSKLIEQTAKSTSYQSVISDKSDIVQIVTEGLKKSIAIAHRAGIRNQQIIVDPGFGFGKSEKQNLQLLKHLHDIKQLGFPLLSATSRKSFIGKMLDLEVTERLAGSLAAATASAISGANIIRSHDVLETKRAMTFVSQMLQS